MNPAERLIELLNLLPSTKTIAERKRSIESIEDLLTKEDVCAYLDRSNSASSVNWKAVFNAVVRFVVQDLENITNNAAKASTSARSTTNAVDRSKEHISVLKCVLEQMETRLHMPHYVSQEFGEKILFLVINQPSHFPPDCVCSHVRLFERFVLNAGRRLVDLNQTIFHDLFRSSVVYCSHFEKTSTVAPAVRVALGGLVVGFLRFAAEDLFSVRPSVVFTLYTKYFALIEPSGVELQMCQLLAAAFKDAYLSLREYPHQLQTLVSTIAPQIIGGFISSQCRGLAGDNSFITACHFIIAHATSFITESVSTSLITKLWETTRKAVEDHVERLKFSSTASARRSNVHLARSNRASISQALCGLYIAVGHLQLVNKFPLTPPSCEMINASNLWLEIAMKWLEVYPEDISVELLSSWCAWASTVLSKPSKLALHAEVLALVLRVLSVRSDILPMAVYSQLWSSVQKAFAPSTADVVFRILHLLLPIMFTDGRHSKPVLIIPIPQLFAHPSLAIPFLVQFFTFDPPQRNSQIGFTGGLIAHLQSVGSDLFTNSCGVVIDLVALSHLLLYLFTEEVLLKIIDDCHRCCPHYFFTKHDTVYSFVHDFSKEMYDPCDLLTFSTVAVPESLSSYWLNSRLDNCQCPSKKRFPCSYCPSAIDVLYFKVVDTLKEALDTTFPGTGAEESFVKLSFIGHLSLTGSLGTLGLSEYARELSHNFAKVFASIEPSLMLSNALRFFVVSACRAKVRNDRDALLFPFLVSDFVSFMYQRVVGEIKSTINPSAAKNISFSVTNSLSADEFVEHSESGVDNIGSNAQLTSTGIKPYSEFSVEQATFVTELRLLISLLNCCDMSISCELATALLKKLQTLCNHRSRNIFFHCLALISSELAVRSMDVYTAICSLIARSLSIFFRDQQLIALHIAFLKDLFSQNLEQWGCPFDSFKPIITPLIVLLREKHDNLTTVAKLSLLGLLSKFATTSESSLASLELEPDGEGVSLSHVLLSFLSDNSMTIRLAAIRRIETILSSVPSDGEFFQIFHAALLESMKLSADIRPTIEEQSEEIDNRLGTFLLALARLAALTGNESSSSSYRILSIGVMFCRRPSFDSSLVRGALYLCMKWSGFSDNVCSFIESISGPLAHYFSHDLVDEEITLERLLEFFDGSELVNSGLLEAFLLASLKNGSSSSILVQCQKLSDLSEIPAVLEITARVQAVAAITSGRSGVELAKINCSNCELAELAIRTLIISNQYVKDDRTLISMMNIIIGSPGSATLFQTFCEKRGLLPFVMAAFEKRIDPTVNARNSLSVDLLELYSKVCHLLLYSSCGAKEGDFLLSHVFKAVLSVLYFALENYDRPFYGVCSAVKIVAEDLAIAALRNITTNEKVPLVVSITDFVAPILVVGIHVLSKCSSAIRDIASKVKMLIFELMKNDATSKLTFPFYECFSTFGVENNWLAELPALPTFSSTNLNEMCRLARKCCRSLLRHQYPSKSPLRIVPIERVLNVWSKMAARLGDSKLTGLVLRLALFNPEKTADFCQFRLLLSNVYINQSFLAHNCYSKSPLLSTRDVNEENEELHSQAVVILSQMKNALLFPTNSNSWLELITLTSNIIATIPQSMFSQLPTQLNGFFASFPPAASKIVASNTTKNTAQISQVNDSSDIVFQRLWTCPDPTDDDAFPKWICEVAVYLTKRLPHSTSPSLFLLKSPSVIAVVTQNSAVAQQLLPHIVSLLLKLSKNLLNGTLEFLANGFNLLMKDALLKQNRLVLQFLLDLVLYLRKEAVGNLRRQQPPAVPRSGFSGGRFCPNDSNIVATTRPFSNALGLDWWQLAQAADLCNINSSAAALMYGQLYFETDMSSQKLSVEDTNNVTMTSASKQQLAAEPVKLNLLARNAALLGPRGGGGADIVSGLMAVSSWSDSSDLRFLYYSVTGQWSKALSISSQATYSKIAEIRFNSGDIVEGISFEGDEEEKYQLMWKLADWNQLPKCLSSGEVSNPKASVAIYCALSAINDSVIAASRTSGAQRLSKFIIDSAVGSTLCDLKTKSCLQINSIALNSVLSKLATLSQLDSMLMAWPTVGVDETAQSTCRLNIADSPSSDRDFLKAAVNVLRAKFNAKLSGNSTASLVVSEATHAVADLCNRLVSNGKPMLAAKILKRHQPQCSASDGAFGRLVRLIDAQAAWCCGETRQAIQLLRGLLLDIRGQQPNAFLQSVASKLFASWNMDANLVTTTDVDTIDTLRSVLGSHATSTLPAEDVVEMYMALARYCEHRYRQVDSYIRSPSFAAKSSITAKCAAELGEIKENLSGTGNRSVAQQRAQASHRYISALQAFNQIDGSEIDLILGQRDFFLLDALTSFFEVMRRSRKIEDVVAYRVVGLWLCNDEKDNVVQLVARSLPTVASAKFVPLFYQIAARFCASSSSSLVTSKDCLQRLLLRTATEHPYHTLPILIQLSASSSDEESSAPQTAAQLQAGRGAKRLRLATPASIPAATESLAVKLLDELRLVSTKMAGLVEAYTRLRDAYIDFANYDVSDQRASRGDIPMPERFLRLKQQQPLPILTQPPILKLAPAAVGPGSYESDPSFILLISIDRAFSLLGGVNLPKLIRCRASDGRVYRQLVKGSNDDLRQDSVMQQVFKVVNAVFSSSAASSSSSSSSHTDRPFNMRTYPVVPLSQTAGIIGFCDATISLGSYLVGQVELGAKAISAHSYYRPNDATALECRQAINKAFQVHIGSPEQRIAVFRQVIATFQSVFRFYFIENFPDPLEFCKHRRSYVVTLAVSSMVGYILGLGDRHLHNILLDLETSELVHIDLGVAFEQGKTLKIPETVPFRLTRDLVDGCGPLGVEGTFRRSAEAALSILQKNREAIMTVLEVFSYDPLHVWTLSPLKALRVQNLGQGPVSFGGASVTNRSFLQAPSPMPPQTPTLTETVSLASYRLGDNQMASRVLLQVDQKLGGEVAGRGLKLSVPEQVEWLIQQATSLDNLALIFCGWQAYA